MHHKSLGNGMAEENSAALVTPGLAAQHDTLWTGCQVVPFEIRREAPDKAPQQMGPCLFHRWAGSASASLHVQLLEFKSKSLSLFGQKGPFQGPNLLLTAMPESSCPPPSVKNTLAWWWLCADYMVQNGTASPLHCNLPLGGHRPCIGCGLYWYKQIIVSNNKNLKYQLRTRAQAKEVFTSLRTNVWEELKHNSTN